MDRVTHKETFDILFPLISPSEDHSANNGSYGNQTHMNTAREVVGRDK